MDFRKLRYFQALTEERHFGRAAKKLGLSQPPLSYAIKQLESELDVQLFARTTRAVELTPAGLALQDEAFALLRRVEEAKLRVQAAAHGEVGVLRIGFGGSMLYRGLPKILKAISERLPRMEVKLSEMGSVGQIEALERDEIDIGFILGPGTPHGFDGFSYHVEPFAACVPSDHPRARRKRVKLSDLSGEDFILFARRGSPAYYELITGACLAAGFVPRVRHEVAYWLSVVSLVASRDGIALVPSTMSSAGIQGAVFVPLDGLGIRSETRCIWKRRTLDARTSKAIRIIREFANSGRKAK
jgi:DNA-binding transcriptional LysR family regulator